MSGKPEKTADKLLSFYKDESGFAVALTLHPQDNPRLVFHQHFPSCRSQQDMLKALKTLVKQKKWQHYPCTWVLSPQDYQLLQIDTLNVPDEELAAAARWKVKDLIQWPLTQTTIDVFKVPPHGPGLRRQKLYVVASITQVIQQYVVLTQRVGLEMVAIDIFELAMRNLAQLSGFVKQGVCMLFVQAARCDIVMIRDASLFFSRHTTKQIIDDPLSQKTQAPVSLNAEQKEHLCLQVRRAFDYFLAQIDQNTPDTLCVVDLIQDDSLLAYLQTHLDLRVQSLGFPNEFTAKQTIDPLALAAIGGSLRWSLMYDETTS